MIEPLIIETIEPISFVYGMIITAMSLIIIGFIDLKILKKPKIKAENLVRFWIYISAWEFLFFGIGFIIGWIVK